MAGRNCGHSARSGCPVPKLPMTERTPAAASRRVRSASKRARRAICSPSEATGSLYASQASIAASRRGSVAMGSSLSTNARAAPSGSVSVLRSSCGRSSRATTSVFGETCLISLTKFGSYSSVFTTATLPVRNRSKMRGSLRETNRPSLDAGPGGNGVAGGVGVAVGSGEAVGVDGADSGRCLGWRRASAGVDVDARLAVAVGGGVAVSVGPRARGVRVGVGVGGGVRAGQPASTAKT